MRIKIESVEEQSDEHVNGGQCSICWTQPPENAIRLKCGHIFCFLCIKGVAENTKRCAYCRTEVDINFKYEPVEVIGNMKLPIPSADGTLWIYEGKKGWWFYDAETNNELEQAYQRGVYGIEKVISGKIYVIIFSRNIQYDKNDPRKTRRIFRTVPDDSIQGVAGIRDQKMLDAIKSIAPRWVDVDTIPDDIDDQHHDGNIRF